MLKFAFILAVQIFKPIKLMTKKNVIVLCAISSISCLVALGAYGYTLNEETNDYKNEFVLGFKQRSEILDSLQVLKASYQIVIEENDSVSDELKTEKQKIETLIATISKEEKVSTEQFDAYRSRFTTFKSILAKKTEEIAKLKDENSSLQSTISDQKSEINRYASKTDSLQKQRNELALKVKSASKLNVRDFKLVGVKLKKNNESVVTDKASKVDRIEVSFMVQANSLAKAGMTSYYVQIIDQDNLVLGERESVKLGDGTKLVYSFAMDVNYQNKDFTAFGFLEPFAKRFKKGNYTMKVYDGKQLIAVNNLMLQ